MLEDVLIHDPIYIAGMYFGLLAYPSFPAWLLAATTFILAVIIVALLEVSYTEARYAIFRKRMRSRGFIEENYTESHFLIDKSIAPNKVLAILSKSFQLENAKHRTFQDNYFEHDLPVFSSRAPKLRIRKYNWSNKERLRSNN